VDLTHTGDSDIVDAMAQMKLESSAAVGDANLMQSAQQVLDQIAATFGNPNQKMSPEAVIATAKELSTKAAELAKQLR